MAVMYFQVFSNESNLNMHLSDTHNVAKNIVLYDKSVYMFKCLEDKFKCSY